MTNWLIYALGGVRKCDYDLLATTLENWRARAIAAETSVQLFKEIMTREHERADRLEQNLAGQCGNGVEQTPPNMKPVGHTLSSWPRIRRELEKNHRVDDNAKVPREEIERTIREG